MSGTDDGVRADALTVCLGEFAEAAAEVLGTPSECREVVLDALSRCWDELRWVGRHLHPYANDPAEVYDRFDSARASLERGLWAAGVAAAPEYLGNRDLGNRDRRAQDRSAQDHGEQDHGGEDRTGQEHAGPEPAPFEADASEEGPASATQSPPDDGHVAPGQVAPDGDGAVGTGAEGSEDRTGAAADGSEPDHPAGSSVTGPTGDQPSSSGDDGPGAGAEAEAETSAGAGAEAGAEAEAEAGAEPAADPLAGFADALGALERKLLAEQIRFLPPTTQSAAVRPAVTAAERIAATWQRVHMALLRLPTHPCDEWRAQAREVAAAAGLAVPAEEASDPNVIVPGLPQGLYVAQRVRLALPAPRMAAKSVAREIHERLGISPEAVMELPAADPRLAWAVRAEQALRLVDLDPELQVAVFPDSRPAGLESQTVRMSYRQRLNSTLEGAASAVAGEGEWSADSRLGAAHSLDMVLGGLMHKRPAAPDSWWARWRDGVSEILDPLADSAGYERVRIPLAKWQPSHVEAYAGKTIPGVGAIEEPLVQWVVWTPLRPRDKAARNEHRGRVVIRPPKGYR
ncbi:hypothetical protein ACFWG0_20805 [Streptomyces yangpuensis]|uniref:hypothetical protein n=1 Tax=Streptomyces yangpuensis TaxID=1648182 RepID=UPI003659F3B9